MEHATIPGQETDALPTMLSGCGGKEWLTHF